MVIPGSTWCSPCKLMVPEIKHLMKQYRDKPFTIVVIFLDKEKQKVKKLVLEYGYPYNSFSALYTKKLSDMYNVKGVPTFVIIGQDGKTLFYKTGMVKNVDITLKPIIDKELKKMKNNIVFEIKSVG